MDFNFTRASSSLNCQSTKDGNHELRIDASRVRNGAGFGLDSNQDGTEGDDYLFGETETDKFFRLFVDTNGDRLVGIAKFHQFRSAYGKSSSDPASKRYFDYEGNGVIGISDFNAFRARHGKRLDFE